MLRQLGSLCPSRARVANPHGQNMQPSEPVDSYVAAIALRERLSWLDFAQWREEAMVVIRHRVPDSIEDKVARHLVELISAITNE